MKREKRLKQQRDAMARLHKARVEAGLCPQCGAQKAESTLTCRKHAKNDRERMGARYVKVRRAA